MNDNYHRDENEEIKNIISLSGIGVEQKKDAIKIINAAFGRSVSGVMDFVGDGLGGLIGDRVKEWRNRRILDLAYETSKKLKERGVDLDKVKSLPMGEFYSIFNEASKQNDENIFDMWSSILANSLDPNCDNNINDISINILMRIDPNSANIIKFLYECRKEYNSYISKKSDATSTDLNPSNYKDNLEGYRIIVNGIRDKILLLDSEYNDNIKSIWTLFSSRIKEEKEVYSINFLLKEGLIVKKKKYDPKKDIYDVLRYFSESNYKSALSLSESSLFKRNIGISRNNSYNQLNIHDNISMILKKIEADSGYDRLISNKNSGSSNYDITNIGFSFVSYCEAK